MEEREYEDNPVEVDENAMSINFWEICKFETKEESVDEIGEEDIIGIADAEMKFRQITGKNI